MISHDLSSYWLVLSARFTLLHGYDIDTCQKCVYNGAGAPITAPISVCRSGSSIRGNVEAELPKTPISCLWIGAFFDLVCHRQLV